MELVNCMKSERYRNTRSENDRGNNDVEKMVNRPQRKTN